MMRRSYIIAIVALGLTFTAAHTAPAYCRIVMSARSFQYHFQDLKKADSLNPLERFVLSLILANGKPQASQVPGPADLRS
jgi:hypothetical protein